MFVCQKNMQGDLILCIYVTNKLIVLFFPFRIIEIILEVWTWDRIYSYTVLSRMLVPISEYLGNNNKMGSHSRINI